MSNILLVRPSYPDARNSIYRIPIGLLKLSSFHKEKGDTVKYVEGYYFSEDFLPDIIYITGIFTYWSQYTIDSINYYKKKYPLSKVIVGGIYPSISPEHVKTNSFVDEVVVGVIPEVEKYYPDYNLLPTDVPEINDTQIIWASRGCRRKCEWCYVHVIEPEVYFKDVDDIKKEILHFSNRKNIILYDNSIMQHPELERLLNMFKYWHDRVGFRYSACQGIDGRMMMQWEKKGVPIAKLMKSAGFYDLRFSYDNKNEKESVYYCVNKFEEAGYKRKDMQIFCIINNTDNPDIVEDRYWEIYSQLGAQIHSDRFRPENMFSDNYHKGGTDYFINSKYGWTNDNIRGTLSFMSDLNYATRMGILYTEAERMQKASILNKGKSSQKLTEWI